MYEGDDKEMIDTETYLEVNNPTFYLEEAE